MALFGLLSSLPAPSLMWNMRLLTERPSQALCPRYSKHTEAGFPCAVTVVRPLGTDSLRRQNSWKNMSEIKFLQSCPGLDIATHAPCAIDSGFESVGKLHHLGSWDAAG